MVLLNWVLPLLIGIVASIILMSILYNNSVEKQQFNDLGALIQIQTSRPYIGLGVGLPLIPDSESVVDIIPNTILDSSMQLNMDSLRPVGTRIPYTYN